MYTLHTHMDVSLKISYQKKPLCRNVRLLDYSILDNSLNPLQMDTNLTFSICILNLQILKLFLTSVYKCLCIVYVRIYEYSQRGV